MPTYEVCIGNKAYEANRAHKEYDDDQGQHHLGDFDDDDVGIQCDDDNDAGNEYVDAGAILWNLAFTGGGEKWEIFTGGWKWEIFTGGWEWEMWTKDS